MGEISVAQFGKAIARLEEALAANRTEPRNLMYRDSVMKRFEFTFELAQSLLRKFVTAYSANLKDRERSRFRHSFVPASQDGLLREGYDTWQNYHDARNRTSHAYNEDQALAVMEIVPQFLEEAQFLHARLQEEMSGA